MTSAVSTCFAALVVSVSAAFPAPVVTRPFGPFEVKTRPVQETIDEKIHRQGQLEIEFLRKFVSLPPEERVKVWEQGKDPSGRGAVYSAMDNALIIQGPDAVPYLAEVVRHGGAYQRSHALKLLCDMDRYVPVEQLGLAGIGGCITVRQLPSWSRGGCLNPFMVVDGRRIGKAGLEAVSWAAELQSNKDLRFHARLFSGLLKEDVQRLPIDQQVKEWRNAVAKCHGFLGTDMDSLNLSEVIETVLVEEAPQSIPALLRVLSQDSNSFAREEAISVLYKVDSFRVRLRATDLGRNAIEAVRQAIARGDPSHATAQVRREMWQEMRNQIYDDARFPGVSLPALIALKYSHGLTLTRTRSIPIGGEAQEPLPIVHDFIAYLTKTDPYYPSWDFTYTGYQFEQVLNPLFSKRIERYYQAWLKFKAQASDLRRDGTYIGRYQPRCEGDPLNDNDGLTGLRRGRLGST